MKRFLNLATLALALTGFHFSAQATYYYFNTDSFYAYEGTTLVGTLYRSDTAGFSTVYVQLVTNVSGIATVNLSTDLSGQTTFPPYNQVAATYSPGTLSASFSLTVLNHSGVQPDKGLVLNVAPPYGPTGAPGGTIQQAWFFLQDNDGPVTPAAYTAQVIEGGAGYFTFDRNTNNAWGPMTVKFTLEGSATYGTDYTVTSPFPLNMGSSPYQLTIPAGYSQGYIQINASNDSLNEGTETITVRIQANASQYTVPSPATASMDLWDDTPPVSVGFLNPNGVEGGSSIGVVVSRDYYYTGGSSKTVNLSIGGTATGGTDYTPALSSSIVIPQNQWAVTNWITPLADTTLEGVETVSVTVLSGSYYVPSPNSNATAYIDDDYATVNVEATDDYAAESGNNTGTFTLTRGGNTNKAITVQFFLTGTAAAGTDYVAIPTNITMAAGVVITNLTVTPIADGITEEAKTVVLNLKTNASYVLGLNTNAVVTLAGEGPNPRDAYPQGERYARGGGTNLNLYSMIIPLDGLRGARRDDLDFDPEHYVFTPSYHYDGGSTNDQSLAVNRIVCNSPIASFGSEWGTPLYIGQSYALGVYSGVLTSDPVLVSVYRRSDGQLMTNLTINIPDPGNVTNWTDFATNGFARSVSGYGLTTVLRDAPGMTWGTGVSGLALTHTATEEATNYLYFVQAAGLMNGQYAALNENSQPVYGYFYDLSFEQRPNWSSVFVDQPHFQTDPLPPHLWNKTPEELLNYGAAVTNSVALSPTTCTNLDQSPELRRHPMLDQFVADLSNDPLALANYVQNEIALTDGIAWRDDGSVATESVNEGGVNRGALGVYLEGQGSPVEQCALLVYLLRQAGYPAAYVFPPEGGLKLLDTRVSSLLRMRINDGQDEQGRLYTTNGLITVNYPWVAAYIGTNWVHLFPWIKDTAVEEGLDLYDYMPDPYKDSQLWVRDYILGKTNIMAFATPTDDTPGAIFPRFLDDALKQNAPGISVGDIGMRYINRRHLYAQWSDFPRPTWLTNTSTAVESLASSAITNVSPRLTNLFDTVSLELFSVSNPQKKIATPEMRMADLHNRKLFLTHTNLGGGQIQAVLTLGAYRPDATGLGSFSASDTALTNKQVLTLTLDGTDDDLRLRLRHRRQRALTWETALDPDRAFLDLSGAREVLQERALRMGDVAGICFNTGRVTPAMLRVHAQELWNMEQQLGTNAAAASSIPADVYQGSLVYLVGMSYYERTARFDDLNRRFYKVQNLSSFAMGLAKISPRRNPDGTLYSGTLDPIWPNVDMFFREVVSAGNGTVRLDSGRDRSEALRNYYNLSIADLSAQEHATLNIFYGQSNSVSTVKLLQLAQSKVGSGGSNVVELNYYNYVAEGNKVYGGKALKDHDPAIWSKVVEQILHGQGYTVAWVPPGTQTTDSGSFSGMTALILGVNRYDAIIGNNQYGAFGDQLSFGSLWPLQLPEWSLESDLFSNYTLSLSEPTPSTWQPAGESSSTFNLTSDYGLLSNGSLQANPYQTQSGDLWSWMYNDTSGSFLSTYSQVTDLGSLGLADFRNGNGVVGTIADPVNTLSGEFYVDEVDMTLPGPMPLQVRRNYGSHNLAANALGYGWKLNYMPYLSVTPTNDIIYAAEPDGSVLAFGVVGANLWAPTAALNPTLNNYTKSGIGSVGNYFNARLGRETVGSTNYYYLTNGDGSRRVFQEMSFPLMNSADWDRLRPYLTTWHDNRGNFYRFEYGTNATAADYGQVRRIVSSSGNVLRFLYDVSGRIVEAYSLDGRRLQYDYDLHGDLVGVTRPDTSEIRYEYQIDTWTTNGVTNVYSTHLLTKEIKPDGRVLKNEYDDQRRVTNQWATVGPDLRLVRNATFIYTNNFSLTNLTASLTGTTTVLDYTNNPTTYSYTNGLIRRIRDPLGAEVVQTWYEADETNAPAYPRSLETVIDKRGLVTHFFYDNRGNVTNTNVRGDFRGDGNTNTLMVTVSIFNENSLPTLTVDASGTTNLFFYTNTWMLARQETWPSNATPAQAITNLYTYATVTNATDGTVSHGLRVQEIKAAGTTDAATNEWAYSSRGFPTQQTRYTGTADPAMIVTNLHNYRGELALQQDAAGRMTRFGFDPMGRPQSREVFDAGQGVPMAWEFSYYNENGELVWSDGPRYNPEDYVWRDYDGAGRKSQEIHWRSRAREDGTGVEAETGDALYATMFQQHDAFGNLIRVTDPRGNYSVKKYDSIGQLLREEFYDANGVLLSTNGFRYNAAGDVTNAFNALGGLTETQFTSTGKPKYQKNPDGSTNAWRYYVDGRLHREIQRNGAYWETTYNDANRTATRIFRSSAGIPLATNSTMMDRRGNVIVQTDAAGNSFTNYFDGLNRIKWSAGPMLVFENPPDLPAPGGPPPPIQQASTNFYDAAGLTLTNINALGEKTITQFDALGRTLRTEIRSGTGTLVRETSARYTPDHHGMTVTNGSGAGAIVSTSFTDNDNRPVLSIAYPNANLREFTRSEYDLSGNLAFAGRYSSSNAVVTFWSGAIHGYDGLNRRITTLDRDNALTTFDYDALNNLTNRVMPGGLKWRAEYNNAGQLLKSWNLADSAGTRTNTFTYYAANNSFAGLRATHTDGRGVVCTYDYDTFLRPVTESYSGTLPEHDKTTVRIYDGRGLVTDISESFESGGTGPSTAIKRSYDPYGQLAGETVWLGGIQHSMTSQQWNSAGRRDWLSFFGFTYNYGWRADGQLTGVTAGWANGGYNYDTAGLLTSRTMNGLLVNVTGRDGVGRITGRTSAVNLTDRLSETMSRTGDGLLSAHTLARADDFTDSRSYDYEAWTRRLITERLSLDASKGWTNVFDYDEGENGGPGVLSRVAEPHAGGAEWTATLDGFNRIERETNNVVRRPATGRLNATPQFGTVSVALDGRALSVNTFNTADGNWPTEWRTEMELRPGARTLTATAQHSSGMFTTNSSVTFTNNAVDQTTVSHFAEGQLSYRIWKNSAGETNRIQTFTWDARSRLIATTEVDADNNGYNWSAVYDGLGRRLQTTTIIVTNGVALTAQPKTIYQYYDPSVEFLELGVNVGGKNRWKIYGPDLDGRYGGMNGTGGLDGIVDDVNLVRPVISDVRGNVLGTFEIINGLMTWNASRSTGYGAVPEYRPLSLSDNGDVGSAVAWRGRWPDRSGLYWLGARYFDPVAGRFISCDPYGHDADPSLYAFAGGNPIDGFDPDGRWGKQQVDYSHELANTGNVGNQFLAMGYGLVGALAQIPDGIGRTFSGASAGMAQANQEISTYTGGQAWLANPLRLTGNFAFGATSLFNDPVNSVAGMPEGFVNFGARIGSDIYNIGANPSVYAGFNLAEDAIGVFGLSVGAARGLTITGVTAPLENFAARSYFQVTRGAQWESYYNSFAPGTARLNVTLGGETLFRAADSSGSATFGEFASVERPFGPADAIRGNALSPTITGNQASQLFQVTTSPGFAIGGTAAAQGAGYPGGFSQVFQPRPSPNVSPWSSVQNIGYGR